MDSNKRHELETNDLREFLDNFKDFWNKHGNSILIALIVVVGSFVAIRFYKNAQVTKANESAHALETATSAEHFLSIAQDFPSIRHIALVRAGDLFREEGLVALIAGEDAEAQEKLEKSADAYQQVVEEEDYAAEWRITAYLGLAVVAEDQGKWDDAKAAYDQAYTLAGEQFPQLALNAQVGRDRLAGLQVAVAFGPEVVVVPPTGATDLPGAGIDFNDLDGDGVRDSIQRPQDMPEPGSDLTTPLPGTGTDPLFPDDGTTTPDDPTTPGNLGDPFGDNPLVGDGTGDDEPIEIDPLLQPSGGE